MKRKGSGWGVTLLGLLLAGGGVYGMAAGWDHIQLERGWSLFISGAVALSGGVVTMALGRVIAHIARLSPHDEVAASTTAPMPAPAAAPPAPIEAAPAPTPFRMPAPPPPAPIQAPPTKAEPAPLPPVPEEPTEVDRYTAGDATYVMLSDGSVEVRTATGAERYPSLAALRARAETRQI